MNKKYVKKVVLSNIREFLEKRGITVKKYGNAEMLDCILCNSEMSAQLIPNSGKVSCLDCGEYYNLIDIVRKIDYDGEKIEEEEILEKIKEELELDIVTPKEEVKIGKILDFYEEQGFDLVQLVPISSKEINLSKTSSQDGKYPIEGEWQKKNHKNREEWERWIENRCNIGLKTGRISGVTVVDIDQAEVPEEIKPLLGDTLVQKTPNGYHYIYKYTDELPKTRINELKIDIENDGGQIVVSPSKTRNEKGEKVTRKFDKLVIPSEMPEELKSFLKKKVGTVKKTKDSTGKLIETVQKELYTHPLIGPGEGRNQLFISLFGVFRKFLSLNQTKKALIMLDKVICSPPLGSELSRTVFKSGEKYFRYDEDTLSHKVIEHLKEVKKSTRNALELSVMGDFTKGEEKSRLSKAIHDLIRENKIVESGRELYEIVEEMGWVDTIAETSKPLNVKVPYLHDYVSTNNGDLLVIGGRNKTGKCIKDSYILTSKGLLTTEEIGERRPDGLSSMSKHYRIWPGTLKGKTYRHPKAFYKEKTEETIKIITNFGYEIEGTPEHPIKVIKHGFKNGAHTRNIVFKELRNIEEGDEAILQSPNMFPKKKIKKVSALQYIKHPNASRLKSFEIPEALTPTYAKLLGYIIGDGTLTNKNTIHIYQHKKDVGCIDELKRIGKEIGVSPCINIDDNCVKISFCSAKLVWWVRKKLLRMNKSEGNNIKSPDREIPKIIRTSSKECQVAFIEALFSCEAHYTKEGTLDIIMASKELIKALHIMLLNFGIISKRKIKKVKNYENNTYWRITISVEMTNKFFEIFSPIKYKETQIKKYKKKGFHIRRIGGNQYQEGYFINKITKKEKRNKETYVYDFTIHNPKYKVNHQFWSSGFISHNTILCQNILKRFVDQGIKPYYIYNETGSRYGRSAVRLGMKDGDYYRCFCSDPKKAILPKNGITIYDWVMPDNFARTDKLFNFFVEQLDKKGGLLIAFVQLKENDTYFSDNQIGNYPAVLGKYVWEDDVGDLSKFVLKYVRESKVGRNTNIEIPCKYNRTTMEVDRIEDIMKKKNTKK